MYSELEGQYSHINVADCFVAPVVGVDLGTTNSVTIDVSIVDYGMSHGAVAD